MSDSKDNAPKPSAPSSNDVAGNNDPNRRRRGGRNRNPRKKAETPEGKKEAGVTRKLVGFEMLERGIPRHDYPIVNADGKEIGIVTSGTMSPSLNKGIGMGYVAKELSTPDSEIYIQVRKKQLKAKVVKMPFL